MGRQLLRTGKNAPSQKWLLSALLWVTLSSCAWWLWGTPSQALGKVLSEAQTSLLKPSTTEFWRLEFEPRHKTIEPDTQDPEQLIGHIFDQLGKGQYVQALATANMLTAKFPNFQLGQLLYADLLNFSASSPIAWTDIESKDTLAKKKRMAELVLEFQRRINREDTLKLQGKIPSAFGFVSSKQPYIAAIDASKSRFYLFENRPTPDGRSHLHLIKNNYVSVGVNGIGKYKEGDGKTPIGVYFFQKNLHGRNLPDLYGVGALTLNYPNAIDLMQKKTGSGIWLHGTRSDQYARAPESTDGCVVLANPDMAYLLQLADLRMTPVVIAERLDWIPQDKGPEEFESFKPVLDLWLQSRRKQNPEVLKLLYSPRFEKDGRNLAQRWSHPTQTGARPKLRQDLELMSVLQWQDPTHTMVVTLKDPNRSNLNGRDYWRTYWQKENGQWRVVFEGPD